MKLILLIFLLTFLSCEKKSSNYNMSNIEFAEEMQTYYFENENMVFSLNARRMQKETQNINLNISHNFFCVDEDYFYTDSIYKILDSIFLKLNEQTFSEIINFSSGVLLDYFEDNNKLSFNIKSNEAVQYVEKDLIHLKNNVVISSPNNRSLHTNNLFWDSYNQVMWTYDSIIVKNIDTIQGRGCGLFSFDNLNNFKTFGVKGKVNLED
ncbi:MAG: hypothetical protein CMP74_03995 [Flavobacteriales bacterium]|nr:hypothetical protein [Flavobacteriales bacterium]|tara:strand:+ start:1132 stop:1758 length:627 start_codon:yes stop_codon:yes gene_type:complete